MSVIKCLCMCVWDQVSVCVCLRPCVCVHVFLIMFLCTCGCDQVSVYICFYTQVNIYICFNVLIHMYRNSLSLSSTSFCKWKKGFKYLTQLQDTLKPSNKTISTIQLTSKFFCMSSDCSLNAVKHSSSTWKWLPTSFSCFLTSSELP